MTGGAETACDSLVEVHRGTEGCDVAACDSLDSLRTYFFEAKIVGLEDALDQAYNYQQMIAEDLRQQVGLLANTREILSEHVSCLDAARAALSSAQLVNTKLDASLAVALEAVTAAKQLQAATEEAAEAAAVAASASADLLAGEQKEAKRKYRRK